MRHTGGLARLGLARLGPARLGLARLGPARLGPARLGPHELALAPSTAAERTWRALARRAPMVRGLAFRPLRVPLLVLGMSHTRALVEALDAAPLTGLCVVDVRCGEGIQPHVLQRFRPRIAISMVHGGQYAHMGLVEGDEPFDFEDPEIPGLIAGRRAVPRAEIVAAMRARLANTRVVLRRMRDAFGPPLAHLAAPPPNGDDAFLRQHPGMFGTGAADEALRIVPATVRRKLYRVQNELVASLCAEFGVDFIPAPAEAFDREGDLAPTLRRRDPIHGNRDYGALVRAQLVDYARRNGLSLEGGGTP